MINSLARKTISVSITAFILFGLVSSAHAASIDIGQVQIIPGALSDVASWPQTTSITVRDIGGGGVDIEFDKKSSADGWPKQYSSTEQPMPGIGIGDAINHTVWVFRNVGGQWYGTGILQALGNYNDPTGSLANIPCGSLNLAPQMNPGQDFKVGEQIAFMVTAGSERGSIVTSIKERSDIQLYTVTADNLTGRDPGCGSGASATSGGTDSTSGGAIPASKDLPIPNAGLPTDLGGLVQSIFGWSLSIIGLIIFVRFFYAGFLWFTSAGDTGRIGNARTIMTNAAYGTAVLFSAFLILNTINPDLVRQSFKLDGIPTTIICTSKAGGSGVCSNNSNQTCHLDQDCVKNPTPENGATAQTLNTQLCQSGFCSTTGNACTPTSKCAPNPSSAGTGANPDGSSPGICTGKNDSGDGTCSNNFSKTCRADQDCVQNIPPSCTNTNDSGDGYCSNNPDQPCNNNDPHACQN